MSKDNNNNNNNGNKSNGDRPRPQSSSLPCTLRGTKGRYASGPTTQSQTYGQHEFDPAPWQRWSTLMMSSEPDTEADTEICSGSSRIPPSSTKSVGRDVVVSAAQGQGQDQGQAQAQAQALALASPLVTLSRLLFWEVGLFISGWFVSCLCLVERGLVTVSSCRSTTVC